LSETSSVTVHAPGLAHHFDSYEQQKETSLLGMWLFLVQEVMFFGGLFVTYVYYRSLYPHAFNVGARELDVLWGTVNTGVLLLSSFTMVVAVMGAKHGSRGGLLAGLWGTIGFGLLFLGIKYVEYSSKWEHQLVPGLNFDWHGEAARGIEIFFSLYFGMTGMHALHMVVGIAIMFFMLRPAARGKWTPENHNFVEGFGLYWHFVDIVWIFLFPFLYLIGLASE
jgi:cytochrome c oxidase subunit 3